MPLLSSLNNPLMLRLLLLGFSSGLPLALTSSTLQSWFTVTGIDIVSIGMLGLVAQPYIYKFFWAPLMDRYAIPYLGRRRGWMLITQIGLLFTISGMAFLDPHSHLLLMSLLALAIAFLSASQDIAVDAYRTDILKTEELGVGSAMYMVGYRVAMLVSGGIALIVADQMGWRVTYLVMAGLMVVGIIAAWSGDEPQDEDKIPTRLVSAIVEPFREFMSRDTAFGLLLLIVLYKLGDAFILSLTNPFLLRGLGFSLTEVGMINKGVGLGATLVGAFMGGILLNRLGMFRALFSFGLLQAMSNLLFMLLAMVGKNYFMMGFAVAVENAASGMCTVSFLAFLMKLCDHRYTATQYALFSAIGALGRVVVGPIAGLMVNTIGWASFFFWTFICAFPGLLLLNWLRPQIDDIVTMPSDPAVLSE